MTKIQVSLLDFFLHSALSALSISRERLSSATRPFKSFLTCALVVGWSGHITTRGTARTVTISGVSLYSTLLA